MSTVLGKISWTVLILLVPFLVLFAMGDIGTVELTLLLVIWIIGLATVWWPRR